jgi:hypothetical protein
MLDVCRGCSAGILAAYGMDDRGVEFESRYGQEFSLLHIFFQEAFVWHCPYCTNTVGRISML